MTINVSNLRVYPQGERPLGQTELQKESETIYSNHVVGGTIGIINYEIVVCIWGKIKQISN